MSDTEQKTQGEQVETPELSRILPLGNLFFFFSSWRIRNVDAHDDDAVQNWSISVLDLVFGL